MTTNYHTAISVGAAANAATFNTPLGALDEAITNAQSGVYNVLEYGAVGDGSTDDTTAVQATLTAGAGKHVFFPAGTYIIAADLTISANTTVSGAGQGITTIKAKSTHTGRGFYFANVAGVHIADLTIDMNSSATVAQAGRQAQQAIYIVQSSNTAMGNITIERIECKNSHDRLIDISSNQTAPELSVTVRDCYLHDCVDIALCVGSHADYLDFSRNRIEDIGSGGYEAVFVSGASGDVVTKCKIVGNTIETGGWHGITLTYAQGIVIADNYVTDCSNSSAGWGIVLSMGCTDWTISGNTVIDCGGGIGADLAVEDHDTLTYDVRGVITGNTSAANGGNHGIYLAHCRGAVVTGNLSMDNNQDGVGIIDCKSCTIAGNILVDNGVYGLGIYSSTEVANDGGHVISGNLFDNNTTGTIADGAADITSSFMTGKFAVDTNGFCTGTGYLTVNAPSYAATMKLNRQQAYTTGRTIGDISAYANDSTTNSLELGHIQFNQTAEYNGAIEFQTNNGATVATRATLDAVGKLGIGVAPAAQLHVDQSSASGGVPVLTVDQADVSEEFIRFVGTSTTDASQSLVDAADMEDPGSIVGWLKIYVQDDQATNPITDGAYYIPFYSAPTHSP